MSIKIARNSPIKAMAIPESGQLVVVIGYNKNEKQVLEMGDVCKVISASECGTLGVEIDGMLYAINVENVRPMLSGEKILYHLGQEQMKVKSKRLDPNTLAVIRYGAFIKPEVSDILKEDIIVNVERPASSLSPTLTLISYDKSPKKYYAVHNAALRAATKRDEFLYHINGCEALIEQDIKKRPEDET